MTKEFHIPATPSTAIQTCREDFIVVSPQYGKCHIELTPLGDYILATYGLSDAMVRRSNEYKAAYRKVTLDMLHAYDTTNASFTSLHKQMDKVWPASKYEQEVQNLAPQKYKRSTFPLTKPTKREIENELHNEAQAINFNQANPETHVDEYVFVKEHLGHMVEARQQAWQEACELFNKIETAIEAKQNALYMATYKAQRNLKEEYIQGKDTWIMQRMEAALTSLSVPYDLTLSYKYSQNDGTIDIEIILENGMNLPSVKACILSSGRLSVKNKLVREMISDETYSAISLVYFLSSQVFNVSSNIRIAQIALYNSSKQNPLLWVQFDRDGFSKIDPKTVDTLSDIVSYPNVIKLKAKYDVIELCPMNALDFEHDVETMLSRYYEDSSSAQSSIDVDGDKLKVSLNEAQLLGSIPNIGADVRKAIAIAKDTGMQTVFIDKDYKTLLEELRKRLR